MKMLATLAGAALLLATPFAVSAHHGWSSYDEATPVTVSGPLQDVVFGNPHGTAKMVWRDRVWDVVLAPVPRMNARGLQLDEIDEGQRVTLTGYIRRDGAAEMRVERIAVGDKTIELR